jgi:phenylacetic acid degradation operon negative regulatory protein
MARLRPGLWARPDNLDLPPPPPDVLASAGATLWVATVTAGGPGPAGELWDLAGWAGAARSLIAALDVTEAPAERLALAAAVVRHIRSDPLLPDELLPEGWPGPDLRRVYDAYRAELGRLITGRQEQ